MTYALLIVPFAVATIAVTLATARRPAFGRRMAASAVTAVVLVLLTAVFDNVMIAADLFDYGREHRLGILVGQAPIEDYAYPLGALVLLPAVWRLLTADRPGRDER